MTAVDKDTVGQQTGLTDKNSHAEVVGSIFNNPELMEFDQKILNTERK